MRRRRSAAAAAAASAFEQISAIEIDEMSHFSGAQKRRAHQKEDLIDLLPFPSSLRAQQDIIRVDHHQSLRNVLCTLGASRYDVCIGGGGRSWKRGHSKGGCVNFKLHITSKCRQGERSKNQKIMLTLYLEAP